MRRKVCERSFSLCEALRVSACEALSPRSPVCKCVTVDAYVCVCEAVCARVQFSLGSSVCVCLCSQRTCAVEDVEEEKNSTLPVISVIMGFYAGVDIGCKGLSVSLRHCVKTFLSPPLSLSPAACIEVLNVCKSCCCEREKTSKEISPFASPAFLGWHASL